MPDDGWLLWAFAAPVVGTKQVGQHAVARVLAALAWHADPEGYAYPSAQGVADMLSGLARRDVRNALDALSRTGLIEHAGKVPSTSGKGAAQRWRLAPGRAGEAAELTVEGSDRGANVAGMPADSGAPQPGGQLGGQLGGLVGGDARHEVKGTEAPPAPRRGERRTCRRHDRPRRGCEDCERTTPAWPDWCGQCDERTRMREDTDGRPSHCPRCHPKSVRRAS